ncbi:MAG: tetratricopeptide (TPR) repeat protein [Motiliproteus sp.]|jgi:tetratricopeptide (TPR) repeat protein
MIFRVLSFFFTLLPVVAMAATPDPTTCNIDGLAKIGYFDYRDHSRGALERRRMVEGAHFTTSVRHGVAGNTGKLIDDVAYTLRHIPNHPQALMVMVNIQQKPGFRRNKPGRRDYYYDSVDCYFKRALAIAPDDPSVYLVRAIALHRLGQIETAEQDYLKAVTIYPEYAEAHYNLGLLYLSKKQFDEANIHADKAYDLGYPLEGLRDKLTAATQ